MNELFLSRKYLETLSSADLITLADKYGIDIPEDLNRRFIIAELADIAAEAQESVLSGLTITEEEPPESALPESYNETVIQAVHSNPVWLYVFWDVSDQDREVFLSGRNQEALILRVAVIGEKGDVSQKESFDVPVALTDRDQYILLPSGEKSIRVELIVESQVEKPRILAISGPAPLNRPCPDFRQSMLGEQTPLLELSGFKELMHTHFLQHRYAFSNGD